MKPQLVPVILGGRRGVRPFDPIDLFTGGVQGAWYDPSDYSTLFQKIDGSTPVTAVEQPVGLMLDKSQGLVLGSELVTNGDFSGGTTGWTAGNSATLSVVSGRLSVVNGATALGQARQSITTVAGKTYKLSVAFTSVSASRGYVFVGTFAGDNSRFSAGPITTSQTVTGYFTAAGTTTHLSIGNADNTAGLETQFDNFTVVEIAGNHAVAPNDASRPVLRARYNLLTYSEQFDTARWAVGTYNTTGVDNDRIAPDGTTTADKITVVVSGNNRLQQVISVVPNTNYTVSFYVYGGTSTSYLMNIYDSIGATWIVYAYDYSAQVSTTGWARITKSFTTPAGCTSIVLQPIRDVIGTGTFWIWGAQLVTGSSAGTYQRIAAATDYATAGFLPYLAFDGTDDSFGTGSINFSATDKMSVCAGVTKLSDAAAGTLVELTADATANNGGFALRAPDSATSNYGAITRGTIASNTRLATTYAAPITNVFTTLLNNGGALSSDQISVRINAATPTLSAGTTTTAGNFANAAMYIGRRNNATVPLNGRIYGLIVAGKTLSASELSATESWMAAKTGVTL